MPGRHRLFDSCTAMERLRRSPIVESISGGGRGGDIPFVTEANFSNSRLVSVEAILVHFDAICLVKPKLFYKHSLYFKGLRQLS